RCNRDCPDEFFELDGRISAAFGSPCVPTAKDNTRKVTSNLQLSCEPPPARQQTLMLIVTRRFEAHTNPTQGVRRPINSRKSQQRRLNNRANRRFPTRSIG